MHWITDTNKFVQSNNEAQRFIANKTLNPSFGGVFLISENDTLIIRTTNGQALFETKIPAKILEPGEILLPSGILSASLKALESGEVEISQEGEEIIVRQGTVSFSLAPLTHDSFPQIIEKVEDQKILIPRQVFQETAEKVLIASSRDETKPVLASLLIEMTQPNALVASDGFRLSRREVDLALNDETSLLLPARFVRELLGILKKNEDQVITSYWDSSSGQIVFSFGDTNIQFSTIDGEFPNYRSIVPEATSFSLTLDRELLAQRIQQVLVIARELSNIVIFEVQENDLLLSSQASAHGKSKAQLSLITKQGNPGKFACNGTYVLDFLATLEGQEVVIHGNDPLKPILLSAPETPQALYLIMPFRLQS